MAVEEVGVEEKKGQEKNILVGIRMDGDSRDLINWALMKIAEPGDRVIVVHVSRDSEKSSILCLVRSLDAYLSVYEGFCSGKQLDLVGRVSHGNSIRKALLREAKLFAATMVVIGISKQNALGGSLSLAKYCAKKLSPNTCLLAVHKGKIVFRRDPTKHPQGPELVQRQSLRSLLHRNLSMDFEIIISGCKESANSKLPELGALDTEDSVERTRNTSIEANEDERERPSSSEARKFDICAVENGSCEEINESNSQADHLNTEGTNSSSISLLIRKLPEPRPGWPLLRRAISTDWEALRRKEARSMTVVQWAMKLPGRNSPSNLRATNFREPKFRFENLEPFFDQTEPDNLPRELEFLRERNSFHCRWFSYEELQSLSAGFSSDNLIGKGGCSRVYKGCLPDGQEVAVKISKLSEETWKEFLLEVDIITTLKHKHIISLIGICMEDNNLISVYNFLARGNLEENLHGKGNKAVLPWDVRFKVAVGIAEALDYLHNTCSKPVIHRDVKSSNILLSDEYEPQLSDFGLAIWAPSSSSYVTQAGVVGTFGYLAPEYFMYGKVSDKIDVYSFGVVLLELLSGRKPISTENLKSQESFIMWAIPKLENGEIEGLVDPNLAGKFDENQMRRMVSAASLCIRRTARLRPQMSLVLKLLQGDNDGENLHEIVPIDSDIMDEEVYPASNIQSHLGLALLDVDDDSTSVSSVEQHSHHSLEDYLRGRWSRSSSFD